jgi:Protein of unknown function (DUF2380)
VRLLSGSAVALVLVLASLAPAKAVQRAAVLPFEMHIDLQMDGLSLYGLPPKPKKAETERLELVRDELVKMLENRGAYEIVDLSEHASDIRRAAPFDRCDGCEVEFGKRVNADVTVLGVVQKASEMMINVAIYVRDVETGKLAKSMLVSIMQNDDAGWLRAVRHLVKNRLAPESEAK